MKKSIITVAFVALVLAAAILPAQVEPAPFITIHYDTIDPAKMTAWEENAKAWVDAFAGAEAGEDFYWRGYQSGFTYAWVSDMPNYTWLDGMGDREKVIGEKMGEEKMGQLMAGGSGAIVEHHSEIWKYEPDLSYAPEGFNLAGMGAANVAIVMVKPMKGKQYREVVGEAIAALKKIEADDVNFFAYTVPYGKGSFVFVSWAEDRGALHSRRDMGELLAEAVGAEKSQEMFDRYLGSVAAEEESDWRPRPDLSFMGAMMDEGEDSE